MSQPPAPEPTPLSALLKRRRGPLLGLGAGVLVLALVWALFADGPTSAPHDAGVLDASTPTRASAPPVPSRLIEGLVQDDLGAPLEGALVRATFEQASDPADAQAGTRETRSDASGRFRLVDVPAHVVSLEVTRDGHEGKEHTVRAGETDRVTFVLARQGELAITLRDQPGQPVEGAELVLTGPGLWPAQAARASAAGEHVFKGLPAGEYRVRARRGARVALASESARVVPGARATIELLLVDGATLRGSVIDQQSKRPVSEAKVIVQDLTPGIDALTISTDAAGEFEAKGLWPGAVRIEAQHPEYASGTRDLVLPSAAPLTITLQGAATLAGEVVDERDLPVAGARLSVATREGLPIDLSGERDNSQTGELGVTSGPVPAIPIAASGEFALGTLASESDGTGHFRIARLAPQPIVLHVARPGYLTEHLVISDLKPHGDKSDLRVVLRAAGRVLGRIVDARGQPLSSVYVAARMGEIERSALTNDSGEYALSDVLGEVEIEAQPDGHTTTRCRVTVSARSEARCDLTVAAAVHTLRVRVVDSYGIGIEGALVTLAAKGDPARAASTAASQLSRRDGTLVLRELPAPPYTLDVTLAGHLSVHDLAVDDTDRELRVRLLESGRLAGSVVDSLGRAVPGTLVGTEDGLASDETDARGLFLLEGVPPGAQLLVAHHAQAGDGKSNEVRARAGERLDGVRIMLKGRYDPERATTAQDAGRDLASARKDDSAPAREDDASRTRAARELTLEQRGNVLVVTEVPANSAAAKAGLRVGDVLSAIDGEPVLSSAQARGMLRGPVGRVATLRVLRSKRPVNLRFRRADL